MPSYQLYNLQEAFKEVFLKKTKLPMKEGKDVRKTLGLSG